MTGNNYAGSTTSGHNKDLVVAKKKLMTALAQEE